MRLQLSGAGRWPPLVLAIAVLGCGGEASTAQPPEVDRAMFEAEVYPILLRDCAFPTCHGNPARFFRVHGPGRSRLDPTACTPRRPEPSSKRPSTARARC
jgi:hypothetical protein